MVRRAVSTITNASSRLEAALTRLCMSLSHHRSAHDSLVVDVVSTGLHFRQLEVLNTPLQSDVMM